MPTPARAILAIVASAGLCSCAVTPPPAPPEPVTRALEWNEVFQRTEGWIGGDGAATVPLPDGRVLWLFGDSGVGRVEEGKYAPGSTLVNNAVAIHDASPTPPGTDAVRFAWGAPAPDGKQTALVVPTRPSEWYWPAGGGAVFHQNGPRLVLFMARLFRPRESDNSVWNFEGRGSDLLWIENPGPDPRTWKPEIFPTPGAVGADLAPPARRIGWGASVWTREARLAAELYVFGVDTTDPLNKKAVLATVNAGEARDAAKWRFWAAGSPGRWSADLADASAVAENVMDEFSVSVVGGERGAPARFVMVYSEPMLGRHILARSAPHVTGPWGPPVALYTCPEPDDDRRLMVYSAKAHPELSRPGELLVSYCVNSSDFWHMLSDASIYRPRFVRVPLSALPGAPKGP